MHHTKMSDDEVWSAIDRLIAKYLEIELEGTLEALSIDGPFRISDLLGMGVVIFSCEVLCLQGRARRVGDGFYEAVKDAPGEAHDGQNEGASH